MEWKIPRSAQRVKDQRQGQILCMVNGIDLPGDFRRVNESPISARAARQLKQACDPGAEQDTRVEGNGSFHVSASFRGKLKRAFSPRRGLGPD